MKKLFAAIASCMVVAAMPVSVFATEDPNVWVETNGLTVENATLVVDVNTDGTSSDGLIVVTYNADEITLSEDDVVAGENVEMYSANVVEEGTLKIAYLAEEAIPEGVLFTLNFEAQTETLSDQAFDIEGDVYNEEGESLIVDMKTTTNDDSTPEDGEQKPEDETDPTDKDTADTGDNSRIGFYVVLSVVALVATVMFAFMYKKTKTNK